MVEVIINLFSLQKPRQPTVQSWHCLAYEDGAKPKLVLAVQKKCIEESYTYHFTGSLGKIDTLARSMPK